jgi:hypothetical protein
MAFLFEPEDGNYFLRNASELLRDCGSLYARGQHSSPVLITITKYQLWMWKAVLTSCEE